MTDEEFERLKEDEKEHLRKMRALKEKTRGLKRAKKTQKAAEGLRRTQDLLDENSALTRHLQEDAARNEARFELASEAAPDATGPAANSADDDPETRARDLVRRLRAEMEAEAAGGNTPGKADAPGEGNASDSASGDRPDKTIGPAT